MRGISPRIPGKVMAWTSPPGCVTLDADRPPAQGMVDFAETPFFDRGGLVKARQVFGGDLNSVLDELTGVLVG